MARPCEHAHPSPIPETCGLCRLYIEDPFYKELWDGDCRPCFHLHERPDPQNCRMCWFYLAKPNYYEKWGGYRAIVQERELGFGSYPALPTTPPETGAPQQQTRNSSAGSEQVTETVTTTDSLQNTTTYTKSANSLCWAYGVTTVPDRVDNHLVKTLTSLKAAGFDRPRIFIDGPTYSVDYPLTARGDSIRAFGNWYLALTELYIREPKADRYAIFQDDILVYKNLRGYLDNCPYPADGYFNLMTLPPGRQDEPPSKEYMGWYLSNQLGRSACALVFNRTVAIKILTSTHMLKHVQDEHRGYRSIDGAIILSMKEVGVKEWVHSPSLLLHTGELSSLQPNRKHQLQAWNFYGEDFDAMQFLHPEDIHKPAVTNPGHGLGDMVERALTTVGITKDRVEEWLGRPCGCAERKKKLNELSAWAKRVIGGKVKSAVEYLNNIIQQEPPK